MLGRRDEMRFSALHSHNLRIVPPYWGTLHGFPDTFGDVRVVVYSSLVSLNSGILSAVALRYCHL